ncbi:MAG: SAM-dependent methyltransferase [Treponema sp.]|nr:SAM-dependent methyltransferase [Treponema sp.]
MIISATFSKPAKNVQELLGRPYLRIKIKAANSANKTSYFVESFTEKQAFHEQKNEQELDEFIKKHAGKTFKNCIVRTESEEITYLGNKKGEVTVLTKKIKSQGAVSPLSSLTKKKQYLIEEGSPVPFLVLLGVMTPQGKIINSKYDKFRQINRYLEFINDILPQVMSSVKDRPLRIVDFGCGKSYLTFAAHYFLTQIKHIPSEITGLDLKKEVIDYCNKISQELGCDGLKFDTGNIADYNYQNTPDIVITLHACDTATDYALEYAIKHDCKAILSVPCCQHELNQQLNQNAQTLKENDSIFAPLLKYGLIKERFAALATDALRGEYLESQGYNVQMLEFIDMEHTPKNILIRAVKTGAAKEKSSKEAEAFTVALGLVPTLKRLL